jgi:hypothetical protein
MDYRFVRVPQAPWSFALGCLGGGGLVTFVVVGFELNGGSGPNEGQTVVDPVIAGTGGW